MKIVLADGTVLTDITNLEESFVPRSRQGITLSIRMKSDLTVEEMRNMFTHNALTTITVNDGKEDKEITGYTMVDSIRKYYEDKLEYNTAIDLIHE